MVFVPNEEPTAGRWSNYDQGDGLWFLTGNNAGQPGAVSGCTQSSPCNFSTLIGQLGAATIHSVSIGTNGTGGPDFLGAVDAFRIGNTIYDFEARGVFARTA